VKIKAAAASVTAYPIGQRFEVDEAYDVLGCKPCGTVNYVLHYGAGHTRIVAFPCEGCGAWSIIPRAPRGCGPSSELPD
jgi:hypothetical protein